MCEDNRKLVKKVSSFFIILFASFWGFCGGGQSKSPSASSVTYLIDGTIYTVNLKKTPEIFNDQTVSEWLKGSDKKICDEKIKKQVIFYLIVSKKFDLETAVAKEADANLRNYYVNTYWKKAIDQVKGGVAKISELDPQFLAEMVCMGYDNIDGLLQRSSCVEIGDSLQRALLQIKAIQEKCLFTQEECFFTKLKGFFVELGALNEETPRETFGFWPEGEKGERLKGLFDKYVVLPEDFTKYSVVCKDYNVRIPSVEPFNFMEKAPYIEVCYYVTFPQPKDVLLSQYNASPKRLFLRSKEHNDDGQIVPLDQCSQLVSSWGYEIENEKEKKTEKSFTQEDNNYKFLQENRSIDENKNVVFSREVKDGEKSFKILTKIYFYSSEYLTLNAFKEHRKKELEERDVYFKDFMEKLQKYLNYIYYNQGARNIAQKQINTVNEFLREVVQKYEEKHVLPFLLVVDREGFIKKLLGVANTQDKPFCLQVIDKLLGNGEDGVSVKEENGSGPTIEDVDEEELCKQEELKRKQEEERIAEKKRIEQEKAEQERLAKIEAEKKAQEEELKRKQEEERIAEEKRIAEKKAEEELELKHKQEELERLAQKKAKEEELRKQEELKRKQEEELRKQAEKKRIAKQKAEEERLAKIEAEKKAQEELELKHKQEELERLAQKKAKEEELRKQEELKRKQEEELRKQAEEKRIAEKKAEEESKTITHQQVLDVYKSPDVKKALKLRILKGKPQKLSFEDCQDNELLKQAYNTYYKK